MTQKQAVQLFEEKRVAPRGIQRPRNGGFRYRLHCGAYREDRPSQLLEGAEAQVEERGNETVTNCNRLKNDNE